MKRRVNVMVLLGLLVTSLGVTGLTAQAQASIYSPYSQFVSYQYQGDGINFGQQDMIMEYAPDENGIFQVTSFDGQEATCYVYQNRADGLYLLASYYPYSTVSDLRYSAEAQDGVESFILPSNLAVGTSYSSGFSNEYTRTVKQNIQVFELGGATFNNVVQVSEQSSLYPAGESYNYYYAPVYGLIVVEKVYADQSTEYVMQLISAQGGLAN